MTGKNAFSFFPVLAALWMAGCASVETRKVGDRSYSIACTHRYEACGREADQLCGQGNYAVMKDTTLDFCYSANSSNEPCKWRVIVACSDSSAHGP